MTFNNFLQAELFVPHRIEGVRLHRSRADEARRNEVTCSLVAVLASTQTRGEAFERALAALGTCKEQQVSLTTRE